MIDTFHFLHVVIPPTTPGSLLLPSPLPPPLPPPLADSAHVAMFVYGKTCSPVFAWKTQSQCFSNRTEVLKSLEAELKKA